MIAFFLLVFVLTSQLSAVHSGCPLIKLCTCDNNSNIIICDGTYGNESNNNYFPILASLPSVNTYFFRNFKQIQAHAFKNVTFLANHSITIHLININKIDSDVFSTSMIIPDDSTISINIEHATNPSSISIKSDAFNHVKINRLRFCNINHFNGRPIFDTSAFGEDLHIEELIFEQSDLTGFSNVLRKAADVRNLYIRECSALTQLTNNNLPSFLATTKSLEISDTGLQLINAHTFQAWTLVLEKLIIRNNTNLKIFSSDIVDGDLMKLDTLDLSYNSIDTLEQDYSWFSYSYTKHLLLRQQQLDLFLKTNILEDLRWLRTIDFSEGFISENNDDLIRNYFPDMPNLVSINVSHANLTESMIIDLLTSLSNSANGTIKIQLFGHTLNDSHFCSYFTIFQKSPNSLHIELDETHECNCVVDLFYQDEYIQIIKNDSQTKPSCLFNTTRTRCDIQTQLTLSKCPITKPNPDGSGSPDGNIGNYAFIGIMVGLGVVLLIGLGSVMVRRVQKSRRMTVLDMEQPVENPLAAIIEERLQNTH